MNSRAEGLPTTTTQPIEGNDVAAEPSATPFHSALLSLGLTLSQSRHVGPPETSTPLPYTFYTPTPETHAKVLHRLVRERQRNLAIERVKSRSRSRYGRAAPAESSGVDRAKSRDRSAEPRGPVDEGLVEKDAREASRARATGSVNEATQAIIRDKLSLRAEGSRELWGWSMPVEIGSFAKSKYLVDSDSPLLARESEGLLVPLVRFANLYLPNITPHRAHDAKVGQLLAGKEKRRQAVLYAHSPFPTSASDAVFFGPDTYRFLSFLSNALSQLRAPAVSGQWKLGVDIGTGAGAGALCIAGLNKAEGPRDIETPSQKATKDEEPLVARVLGTDINAKALQFATVNASLYHLQSSLCSSYSLSPSGAEEEASWANRLQFREGNLLQGLTAEEKGDVDLIISSPPYIAFGGDEDEVPAAIAEEDEEGEESVDTSRGRSRTSALRFNRKGKGTRYADRGSAHGLSLPLAILHESLQILPPGGLCLLYTGVPVTLDGRNPLREACEKYDAQGQGSGAQQTGEGAAQGNAQRIPATSGVRARLEYWTTIDTDVFGDELKDPTGPYGNGSDVGRIEVVGVGMRKL